MNQAVIETYVDEVWNKKNSSKIKELIDPKATIHSPLGMFSGPSEMEGIIEKWLVALPDIQVDTLHTVEEGDLVIHHWKAKGTHKGLLFGIAPSGNQVNYGGVTIYRLNNGKIVEYWAYVNLQKEQLQ